MKGRESQMPARKEERFKGSGFGNLIETQRTVIDLLRSQADRLEGLAQSVGTIQSDLRDVQARSHATATELKRFSSELISALTSCGASRPAAPAKPTRLAELHRAMSVVHEDALDDLLEAEGLYLKAAGWTSPSSGWWAHAMFGNCRFFQREALALQLRTDCHTLNAHGYGRAGLSQTT